MSARQPPGPSAGERAAPPSLAALRLVPASVGADKRKLNELNWGFFYYYALDALNANAAIGGVLKQPKIKRTVEPQTAEMLRICMCPAPGECGDRGLQLDQCFLKGTTSLKRTSSGTYNVVAEIETRPSAPSVDRTIQLAGSAAVKASDVLDRFLAALGVAAGAKLAIRCNKAPADVSELKREMALTCYLGYRGVGPDVHACWLMSDGGRKGRAFYVSALGRHFNEVAPRRPSYLPDGYAVSIFDASPPAPALGDVIGMEKLFSDMARERLLLLDGKPDNVVLFENPRGPDDPVTFTARAIDFDTSYATIAEPIEASQARWQELAAFLNAMHFAIVQMYGLGAPISPEHFAWAGAPLLEFDLNALIGDAAFDYKATLDGGTKFVLTKSVEMAAHYAYGTFAEPLKVYKWTGSPGAGEAAAGLWHAMRYLFHVTQGGIKHMLLDEYVESLKRTEQHAADGLEAEVLAGLDRHFKGSTCGAAWQWQHEIYTNCRGAALKHNHSELADSIFNWFQQKKNEFKDELGQLINRELNRDLGPYLLEEKSENIHVNRVRRALAEARSSVGWEIDVDELQGLGAMADTTQVGTNFESILNGLWTVDG